MEPTTADLLKTIQALEKRVTELEDERAIRELLSRYGYLADTCKDDAFVELFTDDGTVDSGTIPGRESERTYWSGKAVLKEFISNPAGHHRPGFYGKSMHLQGNNLAMRIDGDTAVATTYSLLLQGVNKTTQVLAGGNNQWKLRKVNGTWKLQERRRRTIEHDEYRSNVDVNC